MFLNKIKSNSAKSLAVFAALVVFTSVPMLAADKVTICHNGHTQEVADVSAHIGKHEGDYLGACVTPNVPEFGLLTGILAGAGSAGSYLLLKRRAANI